MIISHDLIGRLGPETTGAVKRIAQAEPHPHVVTRPSTALRGSGTECEAHGGSGGLAAAESGSGICVLVPTRPCRVVLSCGRSYWAARLAIAWDGRSRHGASRARARLLKEMVGVASRGGRLQLACTEASVARSSGCRGWEALNALAGAGLVSVGPSK